MSVTAFGYNAARPRVGHGRAASRGVMAAAWVNNLPAGPRASARMDAACHFHVMRDQNAVLYISIAEP